MSSTTNQLLWFVIDDDQDDQEIFSIAANKVNPDLTCVFANDGVLAIEKFRNEPTFNPSKIFLDVNMPRMNGIECLEQLKKIESLLEVPIYMCSTSSDPKIITKIKALGATDFIVKPSTISEFANILTEVNKHT